ncbi:MAG: hypothetical protein ACKOAO_00935 [Oxalobacteraceae bacterium]
MSVEIIKKRITISAAVTKEADEFLTNALWRWQAVCSDTRRSLQGETSFHLRQSQSTHLREISFKNSGLSIKSRYSSEWVDAGT